MYVCMYVCLYDACTYMHTERAKGALQAITHSLEQQKQSISHQHGLLLKALQTRLASAYQATYGNDDIGGKDDDDDDDDVAAGALYEKIWRDAYDGSEGDHLWVSQALSREGVAGEKGETLARHLIKAIEKDNDVDSLLRPSNYVQAADLLCRLMRRREEAPLVLKGRLGVMMFVDMDVMMDRGHGEGLCRLLYDDDDNDEVPTTVQGMEQSDKRHVGMQATAALEASL